MFKLFCPLRNAHLEFVFRPFQGRKRFAMGRDLQREPVIYNLQLDWTWDCNGFRNERENRDRGCDRNDSRDGLYVRLDFINRPPERHGLNHMGQSAKEDEGSEQHRERRHC